MVILFRFSRIICS